VGAPEGGGTSPRHEAVNTRAPAASNHRQRRVEAEQDRALIQAAKKGDRGAFRRLVERHQRRVFAIALAIVRDDNDAMEVSQEAFLRVFRGLDRFEGTSSFFTWLYRIVTNLAIDLKRRPGRRDAEPHDADQLEEDSSLSPFPMVSRVDGADPFRVAHSHEIGERLRGALDALPPYHLGVILMRELEGMSYEEMAQAMGVSKGTIMSRLFHARQKLQRALWDCYEEERGAEVPRAGRTEEVT
jgi:RNA polymerase sigma-70 factor (ECF subfamily)